MMQRVHVHDVHDAGDRAQTFRNPGVQRIDIDEIGYWKGNRGGLGISPQHIHDVAWDCMSNGVKLPRYNCVDVVEVPGDMMGEFHQYNKDKCESDKLMPRFSPKMKYLCLSKTHFVHAQKLAKDGSRYILGAPNMPIRWSDGDKEGRLITTVGILCATYDSALLSDVDACSALCNQDNLNASVVLGEDEMQAFGRVHTTLQRMAPSQDETELRGNLQITGLGKFSWDDWKKFIALRLAIGAPLASLLQGCQFAACAGRVTVHADDFKEASRIDPRATWAMVALMLHQYLSNMDDSGNSKRQFDPRTFAGRPIITAKRISPSSIKELITEAAYVRELDAFIVKILKEYTTPHSTCNKSATDAAMQDARGKFLMHCGYLMMKVGDHLAKTVREAKARDIEFTPKQRIASLKEMSHGKFTKLEKLWRDSLVDGSIYSPDDLPPFLFPKEREGTEHGSQPSIGQRNRWTVKKALAEGDMPACTDEVPSTPGSSNDYDRLKPTHVFERLCINGCGEDVMALIKLSACKQEANEDSDSLVNVKDDNSQALSIASSAPHDVGSQPSDQVEDMWRKVRLVALELPVAVVLIPDDPPRNAEVSVDDLRPVVAQKQTQQPISESKRPKHPSVMDEGIALTPYMYNLLGTQFIETVAKHKILVAHTTCQSSVEGVTVTRVSEDDAYPVTLQVRALRDFKKGSLILVPAGGNLIPANKWTELDEYNCPVLHPSMVLSVEAHIVEDRGTPAEKRRRLVREPNQVYPKTTRYVISSPLLASWLTAKRLENLWQLERAKAVDEVIKKKKEFTDGSAESLKVPQHSLEEQLPPFWGVLHCASPLSHANMEMRTDGLREIGYEVKSGNVPGWPTAVEITTHLPYLRNRTHISKGDVLTVPFLLK